MRGPAGRRPNPDHRYTTPTPMEPPHYSTTTSRRDSEVDTVKEKINAKAEDVKEMKRELQAVERDIGEAEIERNKWEEKSWDLNAVIGTKWKELEALQLQCNQAIRRYMYRGLGSSEVHFEHE
nr:kinetochore protein NDC80 [Tanacetum cinerariifolium]